MAPLRPMVLAGVWLGSSLLAGCSVHVYHYPATPSAPPHEGWQTTSNATAPMIAQHMRAQHNVAPAVQSVPTPVAVQQVAVQPVPTPVAIQPVPTPVAVRTPVAVHAIPTVAARTPLAVLRGTAPARPMRAVRAAEVQTMSRRPISPEAERALPPPSPSLAALRRSTRAVEFKQLSVCPVGAVPPCATNLLKPSPIRVLPEGDFIAR